MQESHTPASSPFSPEEIAEFQASDRHSAAVIVLLMTGIFMIGLVLYSYIALIV